MHPDQIERLDECPTSAIKIIKRADVANCTAPACPLWAYRPYQRPGDSD